MEKKYNVIYADPPWSYKVWSKKGAGRSAESHYPTMSIEAIKALPVSRLAAGDCALFLWITFPMLREGWGVMDAWGFTFKTVAFVWVKQCPVRADQAAGDLLWSGGSYRRAAFLFEQGRAGDHYGGALHDSGHAALLPVRHVPAQRAAPGGVPGASHSE